MENDRGQAVYYNVVTKHGKDRWVVTAANDQTVLLGRDRQKLKSRTFSQEYQMEAYLKRNGFKAV